MPGPSEVWTESEGRPFLLPILGTVRNTLDVQLTESNPWDAESGDLSSFFRSLATGASSKY